MWDSQKRIIVKAFSNKRHLTALILLVLMLGVHVNVRSEAAVYDWMGIAKKMAFDQTRTIVSKGYATAYCRYEVPITMQVTFVVAERRSHPFYYYIYNANGDQVSYCSESSCKYDANSGWTTNRKTVTLSPGTYYLSKYTASAGVNITIRAYGSLTTQPTITWIKKASNSSVRLFWGKQSPILGYEIFVSTSRNGSYRLYNRASYKVTNMEIKGLAKGRTYYFKARTFARKGGRIWYSTYSDIYGFRLS